MTTRKRLALAAALLLPLTLIPATPAAAITTNPDMTAVSYVVIPHPDDEWQAWSLVENSPANYKVFVVMTHGEQSGYCDSPYPGPHPAPTPVPTSKWDPTCDDARLNSWVKFFEKMSTTDPSIPGDFAAPVTTGHFPANGTSVQRIDGSGSVWDRSAKVWVDQQGRGAIVALNMGDGDLTVDEVKWGIRTVRDNRPALGLDTTLPNYNAIGSFAHSGGYANCATYAHGDHYAIHSALYNGNFGFAGYNTAATCAKDPDTSRTLIVSQTATETAWSGSESAFKLAYGWLGPYAITYYQDKIFMRTQSFWQRF